MITTRHVHVNTAWRTPQFWLLRAVLCLNVSAGIGVIGMASPMLQEIFGGRLVGIPRALADLAANAWCRDANAAIAAYWLSTRRTGTAPAHLQQQYDAYLATLDRIVTGHLRVPEAVESFDGGPSVSNFRMLQNEPVVWPD